MYSTFLVIFLISVTFVYILARFSVGKSNANRLHVSLPLILSFLIMGLFIGMREYVGRDFNTYLELYSTVSLDDFGLHERFKIEYNYLLLVSFCRWLDFEASSFFILSSLIIVGFFYNLYKFNPNLFPIGIVIFFFCFPYGFAINGIRQCIAIFAFLNASVYLDYDYRCKNRFIKYFLWLLMGGLFHSFTILFLPLYWVFKWNILSRLTSRHLYIVSLSGVVINLLGLASILILTSSTLSTYISFLNYLQDDRFVIESGGIGVASLVSIFCYLVVLSKYKLITRVNPRLRIYFLLFSIGICFYYMFPGNMMVERVSYYFLFSEVIVLPAFVRYASKSRNIYLRILRLFIIFWLIFMFFYDLPTFFDGHMQIRSSIFNIQLI